MSYMFLGDAKMLQNRTPRPEIFFLKADVTYKHSDIRAYYMVGKHVRKKNTITMKNLENAAFSVSIGLLFLL